MEEILCLTNMKIILVYVAMRGACSGCPSSQATLKDGVEKLLKQALPEIQGVVAISSV